MSRPHPSEAVVVTPDIDPATPPRRVETGRSAGRPTLRSALAEHPDLVPLIVVVTVVLLANALYILGVFNPNPINQDSALAPASTVQAAPSPGRDTIDPNAGTNSQANGHRAALDWTSGQIPWWNPYEGVGMPLAQQQQNGAQFLPIDWLVGVANGQVYVFVLLEVGAGISTYLLLCRSTRRRHRTRRSRAQLSLSRPAAIVAAIAFALNGTFAWFRFSASYPVMFLPVLLLGVERAFDGALEQRWSGYVLIAAAVGFSLAAGFPEVAFFDGLFAGVWVLVRAVELPRSAVRRYLSVVATAGAIGFLLAAPIVVGFLDYLPHANVGFHSGPIAHVHLPSAGFPMVVLPYVHGPIFGFSQYSHATTLYSIWAGVGGYLSTSVLALAAIGLLGRRHRALRIALAVWSALALARTYGVPGTATVVNVIPGVSHTAIYRYVTPSVEFALVVLAAFGVDDIVRAVVGRRRSAVAVTVVLGATIGVGLAAIPLYHEIVGAPHQRAWAAGSVLWGVAVVAAVGAATLVLRGRLQSVVLVVIVAVDVTALFVVPMFATPSIPGVQTGSVAYLRQHLGNERFYTLGPIQPDYGAYYGIASINTNDVPVPKAWTSYITRHLDPNVNPLTFTGINPLHPDEVPPVDAFLQRVPAYEEVGVKYLVTLPTAPLPRSGAARTLRLVYADQAADIYELPHPSPYFETDNRGCTLHGTGRDQIRVRCPRPSVLVRRELYLPGWTAMVNGHAAPVSERDELFQSVPVPAGTSVVTFHYEPPHLNLAIIAACLGLLSLAAIELGHRRHVRLARTPPPR